MQRKTKVVLGVLGVLVGGFVLWQWHLIQAGPTTVYGEPGGLLVKTVPGQVLLFGKSSSATAVTHAAIRPYFSTQAPVLVPFGTAATPLSGEDWNIVPLSKNVTLGVFEQARFLFFLKKPTQRELKNIPDLASDWWVMNRTVVPSFLPVPKLGILHVGTYAPGKTLIKYAQEHNLPLLTVRETGGFSLTRQPNGRWKVQSR